MEVKCVRCSELWSVDYLRHDLVMELAGSQEATLEEQQALMDYAVDYKLTPPVRAFLRRANWEFGESILVVKHCDACRPDDTLDEARFAVEEELAYLLGDDEDGLAAELEDLEMWLGWGS